MLLAQNDPLARQSAWGAAIRHGVPTSQRFAVVPGRADATWSARPLQPDAFARLGMHHRLDIFGHGNDQRFFLPPQALAQTLQNAGLSRVGVIKIQGCSVGNGPFLPQLSQALRQRNIEFGYLSAYKHDVLRTYVPTRVGGMEMNLHFGWMMCAGPTTMPGAAVTPNSVSVVQGSRNVAYQGTRYNPRTAALDVEWRAGQQASLARRQALAMSRPRRPHPPGRAAAAPDAPPERSGGTA